jgi:Zn-dependent peptidase ImmA (M78 family)/DNA-binding XRE family transcriptional regulator
MDFHFNPARLNLARRRRGHTKAALAEMVAISTRMVTAYERAEKEPSPLTLLKISGVLNFPVEFFGGVDLEEPPLEGSSFRALSTLAARQREQALAAGAIALALSDWIDAKFTLPEPSIPQFQGVDPETAAMAVRSEWGLGERPIRNVIDLLEAHGSRVFSLIEECAALDAFSFWRGSVPYVFLNVMKSAERSRMDAAHELGHLVMHWKRGVRGRNIERGADLFGSAFLMPSGSVVAEAPRAARLDQIIEAKPRWNVSAANLAHRMHDLGLLTDWQYRSIFMDMGKKGYRTREPNGTRAETSQVLGKVFKALRDDGISFTDVARELGIPVDELSKSVFGLVLAPVAGAERPAPRQPETAPELRLL